jgi:hypothetical protein
VAQQVFFAQETIGECILQRNKDKRNGNYGLCGKIKFLFKGQREQNDGRNTKPYREQKFPVFGNVDVIGNGKDRIKNDRYPTGDEVIFR